MEGSTINPVGFDENTLKLSRRRHGQPAARLEVTLSMALHVFYFFCIYYRGCTKPLQPSAIPNALIFELDLAPRHQRVQA